MSTAPVIRVESAMAVDAVWASRYGDDYLAWAMQELARDVGLKAAQDHGVKDARTGPGPRESVWMVVSLMVVVDPEQLLADYRELNTLRDQVRGLL